MFCKHLFWPMKVSDEWLKGIQLPKHIFWCGTTISKKTFLNVQVVFEQSYILKLSFFIQTFCVITKILTSDVTLSSQTWNSNIICHGLFYIINYNINTVNSLYFSRYFNFECFLQKLEQKMFSVNPHWSCLWYNIWCVNRNHIPYCIPYISNWILCAHRTVITLFTYVKIKVETDVLLEFW